MIIDKQYGNRARVLSPSKFGNKPQSKMVIYIVVDFVVVCCDKYSDMVGVV